MVLKALRTFYDFNYHRILKLCEFEEFACPNLWKLDDYIKSLKAEQTKKDLNRKANFKLNDGIKVIE